MTVERKSVFKLFSIVREEKESFGFHRLNTEFYVTNPYALVFNIEAKPMISYETSKLLILKATQL